MVFTLRKKNKQNEKNDYHHQNLQGAPAFSVVISLLLIQLEH